MRPVSDRPVPLSVVRPGPGALRHAAPYGARAYGEAAQVGQRVGERVGAGDQGRGDRPRALEAPAAEATRALRDARPAAPGVETEVSIRVFADGGSISVVRHLRGGTTVGIEAMIR